MKNVKLKTNKLLSVFLVLTILVSMFSGLGLVNAAITTNGKTADISTMDSWKDLFPKDNTNQAGRIWTDKSVFTNADEFQNLQDVNGDSAAITMTNENENFLVALSALASNKSIVGYSYTPTDTMLVLDASGSMSKSNYVDDLVTAANSAIKELLALNKHNRVGVVLYSGNTNFGNSSGNTATVLLPLDRYTQSNNVFLINNGQNSISINRGVQNKAQQGTNTYMTQSSKSVSGGTYIQNGVYMAMEEFLDVEDTIIPDGQNQAGTTRTPIFVLMSDGEPTTATTYINGRTGNNVTGIGTSNLGNGGEIDDNVLYNVVDFVNQLTAANAKAQVDAHYAATTPLFYTLGLGSNNSDLNNAVLNPSGYTNTDTLWNGYITTTNGSAFMTDIEEKEYDKGRDITEQGSIEKIANITSIDQKNYVTEYFAANNAASLITAFNKIVNQIIIQSLYYPTLVESGDHDNDGFIEFIDDIGHYMDVKDIKGITIGDTLFTGERLAKNFTSDATSSDFIDENGNYTEIGNNMVWSVQQRIGIDDTKTARDLINRAYETGQLRYNSADDWSNFIGWYADDAGNFKGHWHKGHTADDIPEGATYINRSYGMLGEVGDGHTASDMMYVSTQVHTRISDGNVSFIWRVPASLIPIVSYNITLNGETINTATGATIEYDAAEPIRIIFEVGLVDSINAVNVTDMVTDTAEHILDEDGDGVSDDGKYYFYTNWWNDDKLSHTNPSKVQDTIVFFEPSVQNERYYYAEETPVFVNTGTAENPVYTKYSGAMPTATDGNTYYREYAVFVGSNIEFWYEEMSDDTISVLTAENQNTDGTWDVPMGTIHRVLEPYNLEKDDKTLTATLDYVRYPVIEEIPDKDAFHVGSLLGNNGRIAVDIPQGIKIAKTVDETLYGTDETFSFTVTAEGVSGSVEAYKESADGTLTPTAVTFTNGSATVSMKAGEAVYLLGLDEAVYTVTENVDGDYKVKSITVDGVAQAGTASAAAAVRQYELTEVEFENTLVVDNGTIVVSKEISHDELLTYNDKQEYTFEWYNKETPDNKQTFTIKADETKVIDGLADGTYVVNEINIPEGYAPRNNNIEVTVTDSAVVPVHFINDYTPNEIKPINVTVSGTKTLDGRDWKEGDSFSFKLQQLSGANWVDVAERTVAYGDSDYDYTFDFVNDAELKNLALTTLGTHYFRIIEVIPETKLGGVTYDENYRYFNIDVTDETMDGYLEISEVVATAPVTVTSTGSDSNIMYNLDADFTNTYAATGSDDIIITVDKTVTDRVGAGTGKDGFTFGLYTVGGTEPIRVTEPTDENGHTEFNLTFPATSVGRTYNFEIREIVPEEKIEGMTYVTDPVPVTIKIVDNLDGTITAVVETDTETREDITVDFENVYDPADAEVTLSGTKVMQERDFDADEFTFELYKDGETVPKLAQNNSKANGGIFTFETLTFDTIGTYNYTVKEKKGMLGGVNYSGKEYDIEIIVTDDTDNDGKLNAEVKIDGATVAADAIVSTIEFVNTYKAASVDVALEATKTIDGRDLVDGEFKFDLYNDDTDTVEQDDVKLILQADGTGKITFEKLTFNKADTYNYVVYEDEVDGNGVKVDTTRYAVTIVVTDDGDGQLDAEVKVDGITVTGSTADAIVFENEYTAESVDVILEATKKLEGRDLVDGEFKFDLYNDDTDTVEQDDVKLILQADGTGKITFEKLTFNKADTYNYVIYEDEVDGNGIKVDTTRYAVTIVVTDDGNGKLEAEVKVDGTTVTGSTASAIVFENKYQSEPVKYYIDMKKTHLREEGKEMGTFNFVLNVDGVDKQKVSNDAEGNIDFAPVEFTETGTYTITVSEEKSILFNLIRWDENVYTFTINVDDNKEGELVIGNVEIKNLKNRDDLAFVNVDHDKITHKDVFLGDDTAIRIDGKDVNAGETLRYAISYTNYTGVPVDVTITDIVPEHTTYVENSADNKGVYNSQDNTLTWNLTNIAKDTTVTVTFEVIVDDANATVSNAATVIEGENIYKTNTVTNTTVDDEVVKNVFNENNPKVSIDGKKVYEGDTLTYAITYVNNDNFAEKVTITDKIPEYTTYVVDSADNDGVYDNGELTWELDIAAGETVTVQFKVTVNDEKTAVSIENEAKIRNGKNTYKTNSVTNYTVQDEVEKTVYFTDDASADIDGSTVKAGDKLGYGITYKNTSDETATVTIIDNVPEHTTYVADSANNGGVYADGVITWELEVAAGETVTVTFAVTVNDVKGAQISNQAIVREGNNTYTTNEVKTPVAEPLDPNPTPDPEPNPQPEDSTSENPPKPAPEKQPDSPKTGDSTNLTAWLAVVFISGAIIFATGKKLKRLSK